MRSHLSRLRRAVLAAGLSGCLWAVVAGSASAATTLGQNDPGGAGTCGSDSTFIQTATAPGVPSYVVPAGGGVITSWSFAAGSTAGEQDKLKVVRPTATANQFLVVGESALETMTPSTLNTFPLRMPVQAGDLLGLFTVDGNDCVVTTHTTGNTDDYISGADPAPGTTFTGFPESGGPREAYNVSARLEPDADHDGWGDETQDACVGVSGSVQGCPRADLSISMATSASSVLRGGTVTDTLTATNTGPDAVPNVVLTDRLASGATLVSASGGSCTGSTVVSCSVGTLDSGGTATVKLLVRMTSLGSKTDAGAVSSATLDTAGQAASGAGDANPANNAASATTAVLGIASAAQSHARWREPRHPKLATFSEKQAPVGTTFRFLLDGPARVRFDFSQSAPGRRVHGKCVAKTNRNKHNRSCARTVHPGTLRFAGHTGLNTVTFEGRVSTRVKLKPGTYTLVITATTPGLGSTSATLRFTIAP